MKPLASANAGHFLQDPYLVPLATLLDVKTLLDMFSTCPAVALFFNLH